MSTQRNEQELNLEQLSQVVGGEDGGFRRENSGLGPTEGIIHESKDPADRLLNEEELTQVSAGADGGFRHENPGFGPTEGLIK